MDTTGIVQVGMILIFMWFCFLEIRNGCNSSSSVSLASGNVPSLSYPTTSILPKFNMPSISTSQIIMFSVATLIGALIAYFIQKHVNKQESMNSQEEQSDSNRTRKSNRERRRKRTSSKVSTRHLDMKTDEDDDEDEEDSELFMGENSGRSFYSFIEPSEVSRLMKNYRPGKCKPHGKVCPPCPQYAETTPVGYLTNKGWSQKSIMYDDFTDKHFS